MTATLSPDDNPPTLPAAGTLYGLPELAEAVANAIRLEEKHRALIERLESAILRQSQEAADSARRAGFGKIDAQNAGTKMDVKVRNDVRKISEDDRWTILRQLDALASGLSASDSLWASPVVALARMGLGTDKRTNHMAQLSGAGPAELKTAAMLAAATLDRVLGASVASLLDRMPAKQRIASPQELADRLIGDDVRQARAAIAAIKQAHQRALNADREFASGRRNATARIASALAERDSAMNAGAAVEAE
ncbi:hypothetical protein [Pseudorhodobacter sp.]|uniref:hypothetical protein n=1 Tax=Pseudorhodobacter sp. TaxID=1934400 RepID=UPI002649F948|nr:hypothetical protein [Pseudorhodobacter sp.]MDN5787503.1 hypothetical protein [Pseudorhodobacter sp.]